jgi:hypothetical protein
MPSEPLRRQPNLSAVLVAGGRGLARVQKAASNDAGFCNHFTLYPDTPHSQTDIITTTTNLIILLSFVSDAAGRAGSAHLRLFVEVAWLSLHHSSEMVTANPHMSKTDKVFRPSLTQSTSDIIYNDADNILMVLPGLDHRDAGSHHETARIFCAILINN